MKYHLTSPQLQLTVDSVGAEITSLVTATGRQVIWDARPAFWDSHSPLLFPCVGGNWQGRILVDGKAYPLRKHGFLTDYDFCFVEQTADSLHLLANETPRSLEMFPYNFFLHVIYQLSGDTLIVRWIVENTGPSPMPFMIGAHPGFMLPDFRADDAVHGYLRFPQADALVSKPTLPKGFVHPQETEQFPLTDHLLPLTNETFQCDTILDIRGQITQAELLDKEKQPLVSMTFPSPVLALWSPCGGKAPFVCIEPWWGLCDAQDSTVAWPERPFVNTLASWQAWHCTYEIRVSK